MNLDHDIDALDLDLGSFGMAYSDLPPEPVAQRFVPPTLHEVRHGVTIPVTLSGLY